MGPTHMIHTWTIRAQALLQTNNICLNCSLSRAFGCWIAESNAERDEREGESELILMANKQLTGLLKQKQKLWFGHNTIYFYSDTVELVKARPRYRVSY